MLWRSLLLVPLLLLPFEAHAASIGFVHSSGVWFSQEPPFSGIAVKAYTVVLNNEYKSLTATIAFFDDGKEFARTTITIPEEEARQISAIWSPSFGKHAVAAKFISATGTDSSGNVKQLSQSELDNFTAPISRNVDIDNDSDRDGIGDRDEISTYGTSPTKFDTDDDTLSDKEEIFKYKTNPKNPNTDGDSMNDGDEVRAGRNPLVKDDPAPPPPPAPVVVQKATPTPEPTKPQPKIVAAPVPTQSNTSSDQKKTTTAVKPAPKQITPIVVTEISVTSTMATTSTLETITTTTSTVASIKTKPPTTEDENGSWITVLGVIAALFAVGAAVTGGLAWREKNRY